MKRGIVIVMAGAVVATLAAGASAEERSYERTGYYHGPLPVPLPVVGHWPPGYREGEEQAAPREHAHRQAHRGSYQKDYYGRITQIDRENWRLHARSFFGLGPEWEFQLSPETLIERWDGSERWEFSNLGRGQYVHIMYDEEDGRKAVKAMHVSWMAQKR